MRALGASDAFPAGDRVLMRALGADTPVAAQRAAQAWRPWRARAVLHLWRRAQPPPAHSPMA
jgi:3-methyladenine DNA glycosylase/8-oxoguanine DNA glycosylase